MCQPEVAWFHAISPCHRQQIKPTRPFHSGLLTHEACFSATCWRHRSPTPNGSEWSISPWKSYRDPGSRPSSMGRFLPTNIIKNDHSSLVVACSSVESHHAIGQQRLIAMASMVWMWSLGGGNNCHVSQLREVEGPW